MNGSERPTTAPEVTAGDFRAYPKDHPLWQDSNFTPDWLLDRITNGPHVYHAPPHLPDSTALQPYQQREAITAAIARLFMNWTEAEDLVITYAASATGQREGINLQAVAPVLDRPLDMVEARWRQLEVGWGKLGEAAQVRQLAEGRALATNNLGLRPLTRPPHASRAHPTMMAYGAP